MVVRVKEVKKICTQHLAWSWQHTVDGLIEIESESTALMGLVTQQENREQTNKKYKNEQCTASTFYTVIEPAFL